MVTSPLTGTADVTLLETIATAALIEAWRHNYGIDITAEFHGLPKFQHHRCNRTGLGFFTPPEVAGSAALYAELQKHDWYYLPTKWEHDVALADLRGSGRILEIGTGSGSFVRSARQAGLDAQGIELNPEAVRAAQAEGLPVKLLSLEQAAEEEAGAYDVVCSFQVLEHIAAPRSFLEHSLKLLRPGGRMICCVPDNDSFLRLEDNPLNLPPHHMLRWTEGAFRALESLFPVKVEKVAREPLASIHVTGFVNAHARHQRARGVPGRLVYNRLTMPLYRMMLNAGVRRFMIGHSLYVVFVRQA